MTSKWVINTDNAIFPGESEVSVTQEYQVTFTAKEVVASLAAGLPITLDPTAGHLIMLIDMVIEKATGAYAGAAGDLKVYVGDTSGTQLSQLGATFLNAAAAAIYDCTSYHATSGTSSIEISPDEHIILQGSAVTGEGGDITVSVHYIDAQRSYN